MKNLKRIVAGLAITAAALGLAAPASANTDDEFIYDLNQAGIWYTNRNYIIAYAHGVCFQLDQGVPHTTVVDNVLRENPGYGVWDNAAKFVVRAYMNYCPWYRLPY
jgi:hypothetical protein